MKRDQPMIEKNEDALLDIEEKKRKVEIFNIDDGCEEFLMGGNFLCSSIKEKRCILPTKIKKNNFNSIFSIYSFFSLIFTSEIFEFLMKEINENFQRKYKIDQNKQSRSRNRQIDSMEFLRYFGIHILIENGFVNDSRNLSDHFKKICEKYKISFSYTRFQAINSNFILSNESLNHLCYLIGLQNYKLVSSLDILTVDECVIGYKPRSETKEYFKNNYDEIPLVYIPRKPHPNGLLIYLTSTEIFIPGRKNKIPFVLDLFPHLNNGFNMTPSSSLLKIILNFPENIKKPIIVCDAAFGSLDMAQKIIEWGGDFHFSISSNREKNIWNVLSYKLLSNKSRVCKNLNNNFIFSCMMTESEKIFSYKNIMSSFFECSEIPIYDSSSDSQKFPIYFEKKLKKMSRNDIRDICKKFDLMVPSKMKKKDLVSIVFNKSKEINLKGSRKKELIFKLNENFFFENNPLHSFYRLHFNNVDLVNSFYYATEDHHNYKNWRFKMIKSILRFGIINSWILSLVEKNSKLIDFRKELALEMIFRK